MVKFTGIVVLLAVFSYGTGPLAAKPLIRSSEKTASRLCLDFEQDNEAMVELCAMALADGGHTDSDLAKLHNSLGYALDALDRRTEARANYRRAMGLAENYAPAIRNLAWSYWDTQEYDAAIENFEQALLISTDASTLSGLASSLRHGRGENKRALELLDRALLVDPDFAWALTEKGRLYTDSEEYELALGSFDSAIAIDGTEPYTHYGRALVLSEQQEFEGALDGINKAISLHQDDADFYELRAYVLRRQENFNLAISDANRALALEPASSDASIQKTLALRAQGRTADALDTLALAVQSGAASNWLHYHFADLLADEERWGEALAQIDLAVGMDGSDEQDFILRSYINRNLEQYGEALRDAAKVSEYEPDEAWGPLSAAYARAGLDEDEDALVEFRRARKLGLDSEAVTGFISYLIGKGKFALAARARYGRSN